MGCFPLGAGSRVFPAKSHPLGKIAVCWPGVIVVIISDQRKKIFNTKKDMEKKTPMTSFFCYPMKMIPGSDPLLNKLQLQNLLEESTIFPTPKRALWPWRCQQILAGEGDETAEVEAADFTCRDWTDDNIACRSGLPTLGLTW